MLFTFRSKKGSPYNILGTIFWVLCVCVGIALLCDDGLWFVVGLLFVGGFSCLYIYETFWWWRYERASLGEKLAMIVKLARKHAAFSYIEKDSDKEKFEYKKTFKNGRFIEEPKWRKLSWSEQRNNKKRYVDAHYKEYIDKFYKKYGDPKQEAAQEAKQLEARRKREEEQRIWEEAYSRATPEQKARMKRERDEKPEDKRRRIEQEEFERKVQSTLDRY